jgi:hypothetical protein
MSAKKVTAHGFKNGKLIDNSEIRRILGNAIAGNSLGIFMERLIKLKNNIG